MFVACGIESLARQSIRLGHRVVGRNCGSGIFCAAAEEFAAQSAAFVDFEEINGNVLRRELNKLIERVAPAFRGLVRQASDQVETDIANANGTKNRNGAVNVGAAMHAAGGL